MFVQVKDYFAGLFCLGQKSPFMVKINIGLTHIGVNSLKNVELATSRYLMCLSMISESALMLYPTK